MAQSEAAASIEGQTTTPGRKSHPAILRYALAGLSVLVALGATALLRTGVPHRPLSLVFFFAAVALSAGFGGLGPGVFATALSALACDFFFLRPLHTLIVSRTDFPLLLLFLVVAVLINLLSERLHAETKAVEQRFHDRVQGLDAIIWAANPQTLQFTFVSRRAEDLLGYPAARWVAEPDFRRAILHPDDRDRVLAACRRFVDEGGDHAMEYRVLRPDGSIVWLRETVHVARDEHDRPVRLTGLCVDVTERKAAEEENAELRDALTTLHGITTAMSASLELPTVLATLKQELIRHIRVPAGVLFLFDEQRGRWHVEDAWGKPFAEPPRGDLAPSGAPAELCRPHIGSLEPQERGARGLAALCGTAALAEHGLHAYLWMPLTANEQQQGAVCLFDTSLGRFNEDRLAFFDTLGRQAGVIIQNARLFGQVNAGRANLQRLSHRLVEVQEEERRRLARELHDEIGQVLTGLKLRLEASARQLPDPAKDNLRAALGLVNEMMVQVRDLSLDLRPAVLDDLGLLPALLWHFERYSQLTGVNVCFEHHGLEQRFPHDVETTAYRVVQEALTNVARHAGTAEAAVRLWATADQLVISVSDEGSGFATEPETARSSTGGLLGMRERVSLLGGRFNVESAPGAGTRLTAHLPRRQAGV
jgi:PAS domain S-box-containing protein